MKKSFAAAMLVTGTVIGAGFASGREIRSFFAVYGVAALPWCAAVFALFFLSAAALFKTGSVYRPQSFTEISRKIFGKGGAAFDYVMIISNFIYMAAMLAAYDSIGREVLGLGKNSFLLSLAALILSAFVTLKGIGGVSKTNSFLTPAIIIFLTVLSVSSVMKNGGQIAVTPVPTETSLLRMFFNSVLFSFSNLFSCAGVMYDSGQKTAKRAAKYGALLSAFFLSAITFLFIYVLISSPAEIFSVDMPAVYLSARLGSAFGVLYACVLVIAVFTTLIANMFNAYIWTKSVIKNKYAAVILISLAAFLLRFIGFNIIVDKLYVAIGVAGGIYVTANIIFVYRPHSLRRFSEGGAGETAFYKKAIPPALSSISPYQDATERRRRDTSGRRGRR